MEDRITHIEMDMSYLRDSQAHIIANQDHMASDLHNIKTMMTIYSLDIHHPKRLCHKHFYVFMYLIFFMFFYFHSYFVMDNYILNIMACFHIQFLYGLLCFLIPFHWWQRGRELAKIENTYKTSDYMIKGENIYVYSVVNC